ncbi:MAG: hypothetical protein K8S97_01245, partial [Anaerolineae bacterium]|nr:hypothetical protein [Anaerolineae bacterium]
VYPQLDLVVVFTSNMLINTGQHLNTLTSGYIIPAVVSSTPIPENPDAYAQLEAAVARAESPVDALPETAAQVSGQTYALAANSLGWEAMALTFEDGATEAWLSVNGGDPAAVGLDGVERVGTLQQWHMPEPFIAVRSIAAWDDDAFLLTLNGMLPPSGYTLRLAFDDEEVTITVQDHATDEEFMISGRAE